MTFFLFQLKFLRLTLPFAVVGLFLNQLLLDRFGVLICYSKVGVSCWVSSWKQIWDTVPRGQMLARQGVLDLQGILDGVKDIHVPGASKTEEQGPR